METEDRKSLKETTLFEAGSHAYYLGEFDCVSKPQFLYQEMGIISCVGMGLAFIRKYFVRQHSGFNRILIFKEG